MLSSVVTALLLASSASRVAAGPLESRHHRHIARGYAKDAAILEDYTPYHVRYLALNCQDKHNSTFFETCCHPLLRWQKLSDRPKECIPSASASSAAAAAEPTATPIDEDPIDDECDPEDDPEEECDDETTSAAPTSTKAPVTTSSKAPEPTSTKEAHSEEPTTQRPSSTRMTTSTIRSTSAEPTPTSKPDNGGGQTITGGTATWFKQEGGTGACGHKHSDNENIVAMDYRMYGDENSVSKYCGKTVRITNKKNGQQADAIVADCCPTCVSKGSLDLSTGLFKSLGATIDDGVFPIEYTIVDDN